MKRLVFTVLVSVSSFGAIASFGAAEPRSSQDQDGPVVIACQPGCAEDRLEEAAM